MTMRRRWILAAAVLAVGSDRVGTARANPVVDTSGTAEISARMTNDFAIALYRRLAASESTRNVFFSPYSIASALMMTAEGARGDTAEEMGEALRIPTVLRRKDDPVRPWELGPIHEGLGALNDALERGDGQDAGIREYEMRVANALWVGRRFPLRQAYADALARWYATGGAIPVDFRGDAEGARARINEWIEERTNRRIRDLLAPGTVDALTSLVLTNAIYFKGDWSVPFPETATKESDFLLAGGGKTRVPLMSAEIGGEARYGAFQADGSFFPTPHELSWNEDEAEAVPRYPDGNGFAIVELPYEGGDLSMVVIAPNRPDGLPAIEDALSSERLSGWLGQLEQRTVDVWLPRFRLETEYGLVPALHELGMKKAFDGGADFSRMVSEADAAGDLYISDVVHKAFVEVTEKGTEAAAATAVVMGVTSVGVPAFTPAFHADRPFLFLIRDRSSGTILFAGRMLEPEGA